MAGPVTRLAGGRVGLDNFFTSNGVRHDWGSSECPELPQSLHIADRHQRIGNPPAVIARGGNLLRFTIVIHRGIEFPSLHTQLSDPQQC